MSRLHHVVPPTSSRFGSRMAVAATIGLVFLGLVLLGQGRTAAQDAAPTKPVNAAPSATIQASSMHSDSYLGKFVADGAIPAAMSHADVGRAWCAAGNNHPQGVSLTFVWKDATQIAELVYFGRTAFEWEENWKDYEVYADGQDKPIASGQLQGRAWPAAHSTVRTDLDAVAHAQVPHVRTADRIPALPKSRSGRNPCRTKPTRPSRPQCARRPQRHR